MKQLEALPTLLGAWLRLPDLATRWPARRVLLKQLYFSGAESLGLIILIGAAVGAIIVQQLHIQFGQSGSEVLRLLMIMTLDELAPLLTALVMVARSSSALASELAAMKVHGEIQLLERLGVSPQTYLILPRLAGMSLASLTLSAYFTLATLTTGVIMVGGFNLWHELYHLSEVLPAGLIGQSLLKALLFGLLMSVIACRAGLRAEAGMTEIPKAASRAVIRSLLAIFIVDLLLVGL